MAQIVRHLHPEMTATNTTEYDESNPDIPRNMEHAVSNSGAALNDPKRENKGRGPIHIAAGTVSNHALRSNAELVKNGE